MGEVVGYRYFFLITWLSGTRTADSKRSTPHVIHQLMRFGPSMCLLGFQHKQFLSWGVIPQKIPHFRQNQNFQLNCSVEYLQNGYGAKLLKFVFWRVITKKSLRYSIRMDRDRRKMLMEHLKEIGVAESNGDVISGPKTPPNGRIYICKNYTKTITDRGNCQWNTYRKSGSGNRTVTSYPV
jgi:hypothetical protein